MSIRQARNGLARVCVCFYFIFLFWAQKFSIWNLPQNLQNTKTRSIYMHRWGLLTALMLLANQHWEINHCSGACQAFNSSWIHGLFALHILSNPSKANVCNIEISSDQTVKRIYQYWIAFTNPVGNYISLSTHIVSSSRISSPMIVWIGMNTFWVIILAPTGSCYILHAKRVWPCRNEKSAIDVYFGNPRFQGIG